MFLAGLIIGLAIGVLVIAMIENLQYRRGHAAAMNAAWRRIQPARVRETTSHAERRAEQRLNAPTAAAS